MVEASKKEAKKVESSVNEGMTQKGRNRWQKRINSLQLVKAAGGGQR